jgi:hypothetical protein
VLMFRLRGRDARLVFFTAAAMMLALLPVLPLTISETTTESERFTYVATAFSSLLVVATAAAVLRRRLAVAVACGLLMAWHADVLLQNTWRWRDAGQMAHGIIDTFAAGVRRYDPESRQAIFLLNLPDNLLGAYVYRRGFYPAIQLFAPDVASSTTRTIGLATNSFGRLHDATRARQTATGVFSLDVSPGVLIQPAIPPSAWYRIAWQTPVSYDTLFNESVSSAIIFYTTGGHVEYVGSVTSRGVPFGSLDIPADGAVCAGSTVRFSGWALDNVSVARVLLEAVGETGTTSPIGDASFVAGTRPDVETTYGWLPNGSRAEWDYYLPCALVGAATKGELRVRVTAIDSEGQRKDLGTRLVKVAR